MSDQPNYAICFILYIVAHLIGLGALTFVGLWIDYDKKGFGLHDHADLEFKFHPILMSMSLVFLNGEAIMIYRGFRFWPKYLTKFIHALLHTISFIIMVLGLKAVWDSHDYAKDSKTGQLTPMPNALRPHAWVGLATASLYGLQFAGGLTTFYLPMTPLHVRKTVMPLHRVSGLLIFAFSLGAALMGTGERSAWTLSCKDPTQICTENLYVNLFSLCLLGYAACVFVIAAIPEWIRVPLASELPPDTNVVVTHYEPNTSNHDNGTSAWTTIDDYRQPHETIKTSL